MIHNNGEEVWAVMKFASENAPYVCIAYIMLPRIGKMSPPRMPISMNLDPSDMNVLECIGVLTESNVEGMAFSFAKAIPAWKTEPHYGSFISLHDMKSTSRDVCYM
ncbi:MAG TPA: hypothetical protein VKP65_00920 [Rhodothermales bacterium]|nr:hypothetical protein [Rhodothermales bacterium]